MNNTFDVVAKQQGFRKAYTESIRVAGIDWQAVEASYEKGMPIKVLDLGGGSGTLGDLLIGTFGSLVEYTNVDTAKAELDKSKGRRVNGTYTDLRKTLPGEEFDFVFALNTFNPLSPVSQRTYKAMDADGNGLSDRSFFPLLLPPSIADITMETEAAASAQYERLVLLNQILAATPQGVVIRGAIMFRNELKGLEKFMKGYGFVHLETASVSLDLECAKNWALYDSYGTAEPNGRKPPQALVQQYQTGWKAIAFKRGRLINKDRLAEKIDEENEKEAKARSFLETQARFWD